MKRVNLLTFINRKINYTLPQRHSRFSTNECRLISSIRLRVIIFLERRRDLKLANLPLSLNYPKKWQSLPYEKVFSTWTLDWARFPCFSINQHCYRIYTMNFGKIKKPNCLIRIYGTPYHCIQKTWRSLPDQKAFSTWSLSWAWFLCFSNQHCYGIYTLSFGKIKEDNCSIRFYGTPYLNHLKKWQSGSDFYKVFSTWSLDWAWFVRFVLTLLWNL